MDFSLKSSPSCFSSQCVLCHSCCGNTDSSIVSHPNRIHQKYRYYYPGYVDKKPIYKEDYKYTNFNKYKKMLEIEERGMERKEMLEIAGREMERVRDMYNNENPALTSELFAMREMGIPLEGGYRVKQGYLFRADHFNRMDNLSPEEYQGYVDKFPEFKEKMKNLVNRYDYKYPEQPGSIPKYVDTEQGRYTLIENTGGQMCDNIECTMIGHCVIDNEERDVYTGEEFLYNSMSEYYKTLPIYTKAKNHELCALCILK